MTGSYSVSWQFEGDIMQIHHSMHYYLLFVCVHALICIFGIFIFSPTLLSMHGHSDYDTIDGRIPLFFKVP